MDVDQRFAQRHELQPLDDRARQCFSDYGRGRESCLHPCEYLSCAYALVAQRFGERIYSSQPLCRCGRCRGVDFGVNHAPAVVEQLRLAEYDVFIAGVVAFANLLYAPEPHHLHCAGSVGEHSHEPGLCPFALHGHGNEAPFELNHGHFARQILDPVYR